jgi:hypothetical protein
MPRKKLPHVLDAAQTLRIARHVESLLNRAYNVSDDFPRLRVRIRATLKSAEGATRNAERWYRAACREQGIG